MKKRLIMFCMVLNVLITTGCASTKNEIHDKDNYNIEYSVAECIVSRHDFEYYQKISYVYIEYNEQEYQFKTYLKTLKKGDKVNANIIKYINKETNSVDYIEIHPINNSIW